MLIREMVPKLAYDSLSSRSHSSGLTPAALVSPDLPKGHLGQVIS